MRRSRGFSLVEIMVVVAITAVVVGVAGYAIYGSSKKQQVRDEAKQLVSVIREARQLAMSRASFPALVCPVPPCVAKAAGVRFVSATSYEIIADADFNPGGEVIVRTIALSARGADNQVQITAPPAGTIIRFNLQGTVVGAPPAVRVVDTVSGEAHDISVTIAGLATVDS